MSTSATVDSDTLRIFGVSGFEHPWPMALGMNSLSVKTFLATAKYMSFAEVWPTIDWKYRSPTAYFVA
jgi:hypothetical protein